MFGLSALASIRDGAPVKNILSGAFGELAATVGIDFLTSVERFTFGMNKPSGGIPFVP
ncbi:tripartite tricarboxylate transporter permease [Fluviibacterium sp. DFM31]|uniref:Tripartite tricarboxylate transporter permease n=1 Tax=Meridianimarinicoccus marinus TaxID=3231483 RepID=A0ABV3L1F6_9RHOB